MLGVNPEAAGTIVSGYAPDSTDTNPTYTGVVGMPVTSDSMLYTTSSVVTPSVPAKVTVPPRMLLQQNLKWWRTTARSGQDLDFTSQGVLFVGSSVTFSTQVIYLDVEYTCEFKDFIAPSDLPLLSRRKLVDEDDEKKEERCTDDFVSIRVSKKTLTGGLSPPS
jgi:hypothetical protein